MKQLGNDDSVIVRKADKSNVFVVIDRDKYCEKIETLISDHDKFTKIDHNPIPAMKKTLNLYIDSINAANSDVKFKKLIGHYEPAYIYANPKIHKNIHDPPYRPIISQIGTPVYDISKQINSIIVKYLPKKYIVDSTYDFLSIVRNNNNNGIMASLDVESLFTNVPVDTTINIILDNVYRHTTLSPPAAISENTMKELLYLCTTKSPFRGVDKNLYLQKDGVMMGSPLGPTFANYYMCNIENKIFEEHPEDMPLIYARYVDDIFILVNNRDEIRNLRNLFEAYSVLKFTYEEEREKQLVFLDTLLKRTEEAINTAVYTKTTSTGDCINFHSICPDRYKIGTINGLLHRAYRISSNWALFHEETARLKQMLTNNNFPMALIDNTIKKFLANKLRTEHNQENNKEVIKLFYENQMTSNYKVEEKQLQNIINQNIKPTPNTEIRLLIYYKNMKLKNIVMRNKYHKPEDDFNVVYRYTCKVDECHSSYIGYTEATLTERMRNHTQHGSIIKHLQERHNIAKQKTKELLECVQVIGRANNKSELLLMEAIKIKYDKPELNGQEEGRDRILKIF